MHNDRITIWKNSLFVFFSQTTRLLTNFLIGIGIARIYGAEAFGQFAIAFTVANICVVIADFGFELLLTTEIAKNKKEAVLITRKYLSMKLIFVSLSFLLMLMIPSFQIFSQNSRTLIYFLSLYVVFTSFSNFFYALFRGFEKFEYESKISLITNLILLIFLVIFGFLKTPLEYLMLLFVAARFFGLLISIKTASLLIGASIYKIDFTDWESIIKQILIFGTYFLLGSLYFQLDTILLGVWKGDHAVGIYQSAYKVMLLLLLIPDILRSSVLPFMSKLSIENNENWISFSRLLYKILLLTAFPVSLILFFYSEQIITLVFGYEQYGDAAPILKIFSLIVLVRFVGDTFVSMIITSQRRVILVVIVIIANVASLLANYLLIPKYNIYGAAIGSLFVNIIVVIGYISAYSKSFFKWAFEVRNLSVLTFVFFLAFLIWYNNASLFILPFILLTYLLFAFFIGLSLDDRKTIFSRLYFRGV